MRNRFDEEIEALNEQMIEMGTLIENAIEAACTAMQNADSVAAKAVMEGDRTVDQKERDIEATCLRMLLTRQPVARDLRSVSSALKMITDIERIGDHAADISEIVTMWHEELPTFKPEHFRAMSQAAIRMTHKSVDAYVHRDADLARKVIASDDEMDDLFNEVKRELAELLAADASRSTQALDLLMIAKYFERIGDHAVNIAEWVEYSVTGLYKGEELE